jgi:Tfp pilus assembly protein PilN
MGAFLWRFTLDRKLTDLNKSIAKNVAIIKSYETVERDYILVQKQLSQAKSAMKSQQDFLKVIADIERLTPTEVWYDRITLTPESVNLTAYAASLPGFGKFLTLVQTDPLFSGVSIGKIESSTTKGAQMQFDISMKIAEAAAKTGAKK